MNEVQVFNFEQSNVRTVVIDNEPYFVGKDVAEVLGYSNPQKAIRDHVDIDDKLTERIVLSGQNREVIAINESGVYSLIFGSKLDSAKRFKKWVTSEVLPSIRKNGSYQMPTSTRGSIQLLAQGNEETNKRVDDLANDVHEIKNNFGLPNKIAGDINRLGKAKVFYWLNGDKSNAYLKIHNKVFSEFWKDFKDHFGGLSSYKDLPLEQLKEGKEYINNWQPSTNTMLKIRELNAQTELDMED